MAYSTCCGAETTMTEIGICPECMEHCEWEYDDCCIDYEDIIEDQKTEDQINQSQINKHEK